MTDKKTERHRQKALQLLKKEAQRKDVVAVKETDAGLEFLYKNDQKFILKGWVAENFPVRLQQKIKQPKFKF